MGRVEIHEHSHCADLKSGHLSLLVAKGLPDSILQPCDCCLCLWDSEVVSSRQSMEFMSFLEGRNNPNKDCQQRLCALLDCSRQPVSETMHIFQGYSAVLVVLCKSPVPGTDVHGTCQLAVKIYPQVYWETLLHAIFCSLLPSLFLYE